MSEKPYTLSEAAAKTGISLATLQRYKKQHQRRFPSVGKGRKQRYPEEALEVFKRIREENLKKRGRKAKAKKAKTKKTKTRAKAKTTAKAKTKTKRTSKGSAGRGKLLTLKQVAEASGISYGTAARYAMVHADRIPSTGEGRKRRYPKKAVAVFKQLRKESKPGRKPGAGKGKAASKSGAKRTREITNAGLAQRIGRVEKSLQGISKQLRALSREVKKPVKLTVGS